MKRFVISAILLMSAAVLANSQTRTSYFVRNSTQSHNFNAAFVPDQGYVGFPLLSGFDINMGSNLGTKAILYPLDNGKTGLFLNNQVSSEQFLQNIRKNNYLDMHFGYELINAGWFTGKDSFWTLSIGAKADVETSLPREFFRLLKDGMYANPSTYSIENFGFGAGVYGQIALGYSRGLDNLVEGLRVGGKVKFLVSMADVEMNVEKLDLTLGSDRWSAVSRATASVMGGGVAVGYDDDGYLNSINFDPSTLGVGGFGAAFDLGVEYVLSEDTPVDGMRFSLSVTDLGFISYNKNRATVLSSNEEIAFEGFDGISIDGTGTSDFMDEIMTMAALKNEAADKNQVRRLAATLYAGVDYPFLDDKMNVGLLYSARFGRFYTENELTLAWNYSPVRSFNIALSYSLLKTHSTMGWLITFVPKRGIGIFLGSDYTPLNYTAFQFDGFKLPVPARECIFDVNFGLTISLGGSNRRY